MSGGDVARADEIVGAVVDVIVGVDVMRALRPDEPYRPYVGGAADDDALLALSMMMRKKKRMKN